MKFLFVQALPRPDRGRSEPIFGPSIRGIYLSASKQGKQKLKNSAKKKIETCIRESNSNRKNNNFREKKIVKENKHENLEKP